MNSVVIYGSHFGNTQKVAEAMAAELRSKGPVQLYGVDEAPAAIPEHTDLLVIGGPTEALHMTAPMARFIDRLQRHTVEGVATAVFDTRVPPRWWTLGFAGPGIAKRMRALGARLLAPAEGFLIEGAINEAKGQYPTLVAGELERAAGWAASMSEIASGKAAAHA